jgi:hypothetical protein
MHPSDEELQTFSAGKPSEELLKRVENHIRDCDQCSLAVARLVRESMRDAKPRNTTIYRPGLKLILFLGLLTSEIDIWNLAVTSL